MVGVHDETCHTRISGQGLKQITFEDPLMPKDAALSLAFQTLFQEAYAPDSMPCS